jgi:hypothetical protein
VSDHPATTGPRPADLLPDLRHRAQAGDAAAAWLLKLLGHGEQAAADARGGAPKK